MKFAGIPYGNTSLTANGETRVSVEPAELMALEIQTAQLSLYNPSGVGFWVQPTTGPWDETTDYQKWDIVWDFGMGVGKTFNHWDAKIPVPNDRNVLHGIVGRCVYYDAGTYNVSCTITTPSGFSTVLNTSVTVLDIDTVTWDTDVYLDIDGLWPNAPVGATLVNSAAAAKPLLEAAGANRRLLVKSGTVAPIYDTINMTSATFVYVGRIGAGANPQFKPDWTGRRDNVDAGHTIGETYNAFVTNSTVNAVFHDVDFISDYAPLTGLFTDGRMTGVQHFYSGSLMLAGVAARGMSMTAYPSGLAAFMNYDNDIRNWANYGIFGSAEVMLSGGGFIKMDDDVRSHDGKGLTVNPNFPDHGAWRNSWHSVSGIYQTAFHTTTGWAGNNDPIVPNPAQPDLRIMQDSRYTDWATGDSNVVGDVRYITGTMVKYICLVNHTSSADFATDLGLGYWAVTTDYDDAFRVTGIGYNVFGSSLALQRQNGDTRIFRGCATQINGNTWVHGEMTSSMIAFEVGGLDITNNHHVFPDQPSMKDTFPTYVGSRYSRNMGEGDPQTPEPDKATKRPVRVLNNTMGNLQSLAQSPEIFNPVVLKVGGAVTDVHQFNNHVIAEHVPNAASYDIEANSDVNYVPTAGPSFGTGTGTFYDHQLGEGVDMTTTLRDRTTALRPTTGFNKGASE